MNWDEYYIKMAMLVAIKSKDPSTQVGCVIVGPDHEVRSTGFNGFPRGVFETHGDQLKDLSNAAPDFKASPPGRLLPRWDRPAKYEWVEHAERNAVYNAARVGVPLKGCTAYLNWEPHPCVNCAKAFIQAGIIEVVGPNIPFPSHSGTDWKFDISCIMMDEAGVNYREVEWGE